MLSCFRVGLSRHCRVFFVNSFWRRNYNSLVSELPWFELVSANGVFGVSFCFGILSTLFSCAQSLPLYPHNIVASENKYELILFVLDEYNQYMFDFWLRFDAFDIF